MDLPINFPPGTRFWKLILDAAALLTNGQFGLLDGLIVEGARAELLRRQIENDGVEVSEEAFRETAPPSLAEQLKEIKERTEGDAAFAEALGAAIAKDDELVKSSQRVLWDALRNAPDPADKLQAMKILLSIAEKKQNVPWQ